MPIENKLAHSLVMPLAPRESAARRQIEQAVRQILESVGEDPWRVGLQNTPLRVARMYEELLAGYEVDPAALIHAAFIEEDYDQMVVVKDIEFYSLCEHHLLPFFGVAHIGYIPRGRVLGLSKMPGVVEMFARRLQLQERLTQQIAQFLDEVLHPEGVGVRITAQHLCLMMRGARKQSPIMVTSARLGKFQGQETFDQFYREINQGDSVSPRGQREGRLELLKPMLHPQPSRLDM